MSITALIDMDVIKYAAGFAVEHTMYDIWDGNNLVEEFDTKKEADAWLTTHPGEYEVSVRHEAEPLSHALYVLDRMIESVLNECGTHKFKGYLTGKGNYREPLATLRPYKGHRDKLHKPIYEQHLVERLLNVYNGILIEGAEADDAIGIEATRNPDSIICTIDKDLDMISGWHYNWKKDLKYFVMDEQATHWFYTQLLTGDTTDNIQGVVGIGAAKAKALLETGEGEEHYWDVAVKEYQKCYKDRWQDALEENARLLWISRREFNDWKPYKEFR